MKLVEEIVPTSDSLYNLGTIPVVKFTLNADDFEMQIDGKRILRFPKDEMTKMFGQFLDYKDAFDE